jgi:hypothetical protein
MKRNPQKRIKVINTAGQALPSVLRHPTPDGVFHGRQLVGAAAGMKPFFDLTRSVMSEQARPRPSLRSSISKIPVAKSFSILYSHYGKALL